MMPPRSPRRSLAPYCPDDFAAWLKQAPSLGDHAIVHEQRVAHDKLIPLNPPPIGRVGFLGFEGPHGTLNVRCYHPSARGPADRAALVHLHVAR